MDFPRVVENKERNVNAVRFERRMAARRACFRAAVEKVECLVVCAQRSRVIITQFTAMLVAGFALRFRFSRFGRKCNKLVEIARLVTSIFPIRQLQPRRALFGQQHARTKLAHRENAEQQPCINELEK